MTNIDDNFLRDIYDAVSRLERERDEARADARHEREDRQRAWDEVERLRAAADTTTDDEVEVVAGVLESWYASPETAFPAARSVLMALDAHRARTHGEA